jgi:hypothetical protein
MEDEEGIMVNDIQTLDELFHRNMAVDVVFVPQLIQG